MFLSIALGTGGQVVKLEKGSKGRNRELEGPVRPILEPRTPDVGRQKMPHSSTARTRPAPAYLPRGEAHRGDLIQADFQGSCWQAHLCTYWPETQSWAGEKRRWDAESTGFQLAFREANLHRLSCLPYLWWPSGQSAVFFTHVCSCPAQQKPGHTDIWLTPADFSCIFQT